MEDFSFGGWPDMGVNRGYSVSCAPCPRAWKQQMASGPVVIVDRRTCVLLVTIRECIDMHFVVKIVLCVNHLGFIKGQYAF